MEILVPKVESYFEGFMCEIFYAQSRYSLGEINEKPSWKLEKVFFLIKIK